MDAAQRDEKGKKLSDLERRKIIDGYLLEQPQKQGWLMNTLFPSETDLPPEARNMLSAPVMPRSGNPVAPPKIEDISQAEKANIADNFKRLTGFAPSDANILKLKAAQASGASLEELRRISFER